MIKTLNKNNKISNKNEKFYNKNFPPSTREWINSIYVFNKNTLNLIPSTSKLTIKLIKSYFYLYSSRLEKKINKTKLLTRYRKLASTRIFVNKGEFKHTNNKVIITLYTFNKQQKNILKIIKKRFKSLVKYDNILLWNNTIYQKGFKFYKKKHKILLKKLKTYKQFLKGNKLFEKKYKFSEKKIFKSFYYNKNLYFNNYYKIYTYYKIKEASIIKNITIENTNLKKKDLSIYIKKLKKKLREIYLYEWINKRLDNYNEYNKLNKSFIIQEIIHKNFNNVTKSYSFLKNLFIIHKNLITGLKENKKKMLLKKFIKKSILKKLKGNNLNIFLLTVFKRSFVKLFINIFENKIYNIYNKRIKLYFFYKQIFYINKSKFNYTYLQYLSNLLKKVYNKNIEFNIINLKYFYLNSDILSDILTFKIRRNRRKTMKFLKRMINKVKVKKIEKYIYNPIEKSNKKLKYLDNLGIFLQDGYVTNNKSVKRNAINLLSYKKLTGVRLEAAGRLTRRYTASRSVLRCKYKGNLLNQESSYKRRSTVVLKGNQRSNIQYSFIKHNTRIGSFGLKGWVSGN